MNSYKQTDVSSFWEKKKRKIDVAIVYINNVIDKLM